MSLVIWTLKTTDGKWGFLPLHEWRCGAAANPGKMARLSAIWRDPFSERCDECCYKNKVVVDRVADAGVLPDLGHCPACKTVWGRRKSDDRWMRWVPIWDIDAALEE